MQLTVYVRISRDYEVEVQEGTDNPISWVEEQGCEWVEEHGSILDTSFISVARSEDGEPE